MHGPINIKFGINLPEDGVNDTETCSSSTRRYVVCVRCAFIVVTNEYL